MISPHLLIHFSRKAFFTAKPYGGLTKIFHNMSYANDLFGWNLGIGQGLPTAQSAFMAKAITPLDPIGGHGEQSQSVGAAKAGYAPQYSY